MSHAFLIMVWALMHGDGAPNFLGLTHEALSYKNGCYWQDVHPASWEPYLSEFYSYDDNNAAVMCTPLKFGRLRIGSRIYHINKQIAP